MKQSSKRRDEKVKNNKLWKSVEIIILLTICVCIVYYNKQIVSFQKNNSGKSYQSLGDSYGKDLVPSYGRMVSIDSSSENYKGCTIAWDPEKQTCQIQGTAVSGIIYNSIFRDKKSLPPEVNPGDAFLIRFETTASAKYNKKNIMLNSVFYDSEGNIIESKSSWYDLPIIVPQNAVGWTLRLKIGKGTVVDADEGKVTRINVIKLKKRMMDVPMIVSFVDDDTSGAEEIKRYHDACLHNGVLGNYAVITEHFSKDTLCEGVNNRKEELLKYQNEGFGMCIHAFKQSYGHGVSSEWTRVPRTREDINLCRENLIRGMNEMEQAGFVNYKYWITPGGHREAELATIAKQLGLKCLISTNSGRENSLQDCDKWHIKRVSLGASDESGDSIKTIQKYIDNLVDEGGGWLIITTHFNDGWKKMIGKDAWNETLDENGYPIGYARFNEIVQYAIDKGMVPMTVPEAWMHYEPIIQMNQQEVEVSR